MSIRRTLLAVVLVSACDNAVVTQSTIASVDISPANSSLPLGETLELTATARDQHARTLDGFAFTWHSSDTTVVGITAFGVITALRLGAATVTASTAGFVGTTSVNVVPDPVSTIEVTGPTTTVEATFDLQLAASLRDATGAPVIGRRVQWRSSNDSVAIVSASGLVRGVRPDTATIFASTSAATGKFSVTVIKPTVGSIDVSPNPASVAVANHAQLTAYPKDRRGNALTDRTATWSADNLARATITTGGELTGVVVGPTTVTVHVDGAILSVQVNVSSNTVSSVSLSPTAATITQNGQMQLTATARNETGLTLAGHAVAWTSTSPGVATVSSAGLVTGGALGTTTISASVDGVPASNAISISVVGTLGLASISAGATHTCGLASSGIAFCWGSNASGELGDGTTTPRNAPVPVQGGLTFSTLIAAAAHTCGITTQGATMCWGRNTSGELGDGTTTMRLQPTLVSGGVAFVRLALRDAHTCALDASGVAYCWGENDHGQLGDGTTAERHAPVAVAGGHVFTLIAAGDSHTCAVRSDKVRACWGENADGQLGDVTRTERLTPFSQTNGSLTSAPVFSQLSGGGKHHCGTNTSLGGYCWGDNTGGQVGNGTTTDALQPVRITLPALVVAVAGEAHSCGLAAGGAAYCWGDNSAGQLGVTGQALSPALVSGGLLYGSISAGGHHTCAITTGGAAYCWGDNSSGQLGDGTNVNRAAPNGVRSN